MSTASPVINQNIEIISVLCVPKHPGAAVTFTGLLNTLLQLYPATGWTSDLLTTRLTVGKRQGLFLAVGDVPGGPVLGWAVNTNMLRLNYPLNFLYEPFCSQIRPIGSVDPKGTAVGAGTF